jgi:hypothetical protein
LSVRIARIIIEEPCFVSNNSENTNTNPDITKSNNDYDQKKEKNRQRKQKYRSAIKNKLNAEEIEQLKRKDKERMCKMREKKRNISTAQENELQKQKVREQKRNARQKRKTTSTVEENELQKQKLREQVRNFRQIKSAGTGKNLSLRYDETDELQYCQSCMKILFDLKSKKLSKTTMNLNISNSDYLCSICKTAIESNKMPKLCMQNNLNLSHIPECLKGN